MPREKRGQCRYLIDGECIVRYKDRHRLIESPGCLTDMSMSGLRVSMHAAPECGTAVVVVVDSAAGHGIYGRVVHSLASPNAGRHAGIEIIQGTLPFNLFQMLIQDAVMETSRGRTPKCFQRLGLSYPSTQEQIHIAFRKLSMIHHPDHGGDEKEFITLYAAFREALSLCP